MFTIFWGILLLLLILIYLFKVAQLLPLLSLLFILLFVKFLFDIVEFLSVNKSFSFILPNSVESGSSS